MVGSWRVPAWGALLVVARLATGCTPYIAQDTELPETMSFDPAADPPLLPQPTSLLVNPSTGHIDFGAVGIELPDDCTAEPDLAIASCEFCRYLESLDGFPTDLLATAPVTAAVDPATLAESEDVFVLDATHGRRIGSLEVGNDRAAGVLSLIPAGGWDVGAMYFVGLRGYEGGPRSEQGRMYVASVPYFLLKRGDSLTCGARSAVELEPSARTTSYSSHRRQTRHPSSATRRTWTPSSGCTPTSWGYGMRWRLQGCPRSKPPRRGHSPPTRRRWWSSTPHWAGCRSWSTIRRFGSESRGQSTKTRSRPSCWAPRGPFSCST